MLSQNIEALGHNLVYRPRERALVEIPLLLDKSHVTIRIIPHGRSPGGRPLTWTGRVVSLESWRSMSEAERHGPRGLIWCGIRRAWVAPEEIGRPEKL